MRKGLQCGQPPFLYDWRYARFDALFDKQLLIYLFIQLANKKLRFPLELRSQAGSTARPWQRPADLQWTPHAAF
jgi:hypothetical protein